MSGPEQPVAWQEAAAPFFRLAREVINPVNGERPWHADSKDWMVVFSFAGQSVTLGDLRRAAYASPIREPEISKPDRELAAREAFQVLHPHENWNDLDERYDARGGYHPMQIKAFEVADAILNLAPVGGRGEGWRPIETAPKDGTAFMVWAGGYEWPEVVRWEAYSAEDAEEIGEPGYWTYAESLMADATDDCGSKHWTAWQPLPPPPQEQEEGSSQSQPGVSAVQQPASSSAQHSDGTPMPADFVEEVRERLAMIADGEHLRGKTTHFLGEIRSMDHIVRVAARCFGRPTLQSGDREGHGTERPVIAGEGSRDEPSSSNLNEEIQTNGS